MFEKVVFPVTLREKQEKFLAAINFIAQMGTSEFHLCHVMDTGFSQRHKIKSKADQFRDLVIHNLNGVKASAEVLQGHAGSEIVAYAEALEANYIYIPAGRKRWLGKILVGSTASDVVRLTSLPVFVHKSKPEINLPLETAGSTETKSSRTPGLFDWVIATIDFGSATDRTLKKLGAVSPYCHAAVFFHVGKRAGDPFREAERKKAVENKLAELRDDYFCHCYAEIKDVVGLPSREILREVKRANADLVIIGKSNEKTPGEMILGSTAERVLNHSRASLLITP